MNNKKGFTLIELLAVVVILAIIALLAIPRVADSIKSSKESLYKEQVNRIIEATNKMIQNQDIELPSEYAGFYYPEDTEIDFKTLAENKSLDVKKIPISVLKEKGYLKDSDIKNPIKASKKMDSDVAIYYNYLYNQYDVVYCDEEYYKYYYTEEDYKNRVSIVCNIEYEEPNQNIDDPTNTNPSIVLVSKTSATDRIQLSYHLTNTSEFIINYWKENDETNKKTIIVDKTNSECNYQRCTIKGLETLMVKKDVEDKEEITNPNIGIKYNFELIAKKDDLEATKIDSINTKEIIIPKIETSETNTCPRERTIKIKYSSENIAGTPKYFLGTDPIIEGTVSLGSSDKLYDLGEKTEKLENEIRTLTIQNKEEVTTNKIQANHYYEFVPAVSTSKTKTLTVKYTAEQKVFVKAMTYDESANKSYIGTNIKSLNPFTITLSDSKIYARYGIGWYADSEATTPITKVTIPTKTGYIFDGYTYDNTKYIDENGNILITNPQICNNITLNAEWTPISTTLTLNPNGGTINNSTNSITKQMTYDSKTNNTISVPTRSGYTFRGWYTKSSGGTKVYDESGKNVQASGYWSLKNPNGKWRATSDVILYANWDANPVFTITYDANGGTGAPEPQTYPYSPGEYLTLSSKVPIKTGYTFNGWKFTAVDGSTANFPAGYTKYSKGYGSDSTLVAIWTPNVYTITYNPNGGTGAPEPQTYPYSPGEYLKLDSRKPTKEGYEFTGWLLTTSAGTATFQPGEQTYHKGHASDETLVAQWKKIEVLASQDTNRFVTEVKQYNRYVNDRSLTATSIQLDADSYIKYGNGIIDISIGTATGYAIFHTNLDLTGWNKIIIEYSDSNFSRASSITNSGKLTFGIGVLPYEYHSTIAETYHTTYNYNGQNSYFENTTGRVSTTTTNGPITGSGKFETDISNLNGNHVVSVFIPGTGIQRSYIKVTRVYLSE